MVEIREHDTWLENDLTVGSGAIETVTLEAEGSDRITGIVNRGSNYTIDLAYLDNGDNVIAVEEEVGGTASSGNQQLAEDAHTDRIEIRINDESASSDTADVGIKLR
jgi:hypothetical protein